MRRRAEIGAVLARYQTKRSAEPDDDDPQSAAASRDYYPFKPYCAVCGRDTATVTGFDDETTEITYTCACGAQVGPVPIADVAGKLVWKVDWPMRWAYERVTFELAGVDHASPGSSFTVGGELVSKIFGGEMPLHFGYAFVGTTGGSSKISGSAGRAPTPSDALRIFEAPVLRWLYARRRPEQSITLAFDQEVGRTYDEWDALTRRVADGTADARPGRVRPRIRTAEGLLPVTPRPLPFRTLASVADITAGDQALILRILRDLTAEHPVTSLDEVRPRLDCAQAWVAGYMPAADRTQVRDKPDPDRLASLTDPEREALTIFTERMGDDWSLDGLTILVYGIPKLQRGLDISAPPDAELKAAAGLVHPALPAADREGHRPAAADPAAGAGPGPGSPAAYARVTARVARIEVTEESLRTAVDERVFAQAVVLADRVAGRLRGRPAGRGDRGRRRGQRPGPARRPGRALRLPGRGALPARGRRGAHLGSRGSRPGRRAAGRTR